MRLSLFLLTGLLALLPVLRADAPTEPADPADSADPLAGVPRPLAEAVRAVGRDLGRWAYTQRTVRYDRKGAVEEETLARFDPSQPYDVQWTLLQRNGTAATAAQVRKHRQERAKRTRDRPTLGELLVLDQAVVVTETPETLVFETPLRPESNPRLPPEKFRIQLHIDRATETLRLVELQLRESLRVAGVVKVKEGGGFIRFEPVAEGYTPTATAIALAGSASVMFFPIGGRTEVSRTEFERVTPYDERFQVTIGPLKAIDF